MYNASRFQLQHFQFITSNLYSIFQELEAFTDKDTAVYSYLVAKRRNSWGSFGPEERFFMSLVENIRSAPIFRAL
jgi:hypothetical protein